MAKLKLGMVGGGQGAFIGGVHRIASRIDNHYDLVAGSLASNADIAHVSAKELGINDDRSYATFQDMAEKESLREDGIDVVAIVTPNYLHYPIAEAFLSKNIHVICDKPLTHNLEDAEKFLESVKKSKALFALTHNYTGYPMVRQAREMFRNGEIGNLRVIQVEYAQDWLTLPIENEGQKQASWRTDPSKAGMGGSIGDIGSHAFNLVDFITGAKLNELCADISSFVPGRKNDDNAHVLLRYENNVKGMLWSSQVAPGNENALRIRIYGDKGGMEWEQENPNYLTVDIFGKAKKIIRRAGNETIDIGNRITRIPPGHPEGYLEGFANIYSDFAKQILAFKDNQKPEKDILLVPSIEDGVKGVKFITTVVESGSNGGKWIKV
jgi:predicted dehydrogenase